MKIQLRGVFVGRIKESVTQNCSYINTNNKIVLQKDELLKNRKHLFVFYICI